MRENHFIKQNKEKWNKLEKLLQEDERNPDELTSSFVEITDDLSYAQTFYTNRSVRVYLNGLSQNIFRDIYKNKKNNWYRLISFWTTDLPTVLYHSRKDLLVAFLFFVFAVLIGVFSTLQDPEFPRIILGNDYIEMTKENIAQGDPMGVYKGSSEISMFLRITFNNIIVAFRTFIMGILFAVGTLFILLYNGIMVGAFQTFFFQEGVILDSLLTIWLHGTLEISAIVIAGAAGLTMGRGLLFPKTLSRVESLQLSARRGIKIMIGLVPVFITAGFIEGFLTRYTEMPTVLRASLIFLSLVFILGYFVWYPYRLSKLKKLSDNITKLPEPLEEMPFKVFQIRSVGQTLAEALQLHRNHFTALFSFHALLILPLSIVMFLLNFQSLTKLDFPNDFADRFSEYYYPLLTGNNIQNIYYFVAHAFVLAVMLAVPFYLFNEALTQKNRKVKWSFANFGRFLLSHAYKLLLVVVIFRAIIYYDELMLFVAFVLAPLLFLWVLSSMVETKNPFKAFSISLKHFFYLPFDSLLVLAIVMLVFVVYYFLVGGGISIFFVSVINMNFIAGEVFIQKILQVMYLATAFTGLSFILPLFVYAMGMHYFNIRERSENTLLWEKINRLKAEVE